MTDIVRFEVADGVGVITLNRPERLNALDDAMHPALDEAFVAAFRSAEVRAVVLTGAGRAFCAGADMTRLDHLVASRGASFDLPRPGILAPVFEGLDAPADLLGTYTFPLAMPKPMIAAINGPCVGIALMIAAACDIRFASSTAMFSAAFPQRGLPAEYGLAWLLPRIVGHGLAADLLMSGRRVDADEAARIGLVSRVIEPDALIETVLDYARTIAATSAPRSTRMIKEQMWKSYSQSYADAARDSYDLLRGALAGDDFQEGVASFQEKRPPRFSDL